MGFKATTNKVYGVRLDVKRLTTPASNLWVGLYDVPDAGTPIAQAVVSSSAISTSGGYVDALFSPEASVTVGNTYYIRLRLEDQSTGSYEWRMANDSTSVYADGNRYYYSWGCVCFLPDAQNRDHTFAVYSSITSYVYDGDGALVKKIEGGVTTIYVGNLYESNRTTYEVTKYYYANGQRVAMRKGSALYFLHNDHLGGQNKVTNSSGNWVSTREYQAYGSIRFTDGTSPSDKLYAGYQLEQGPGIYRVGGRFYDPALARFMQPDSIVPSPGNPQDLNRYTYSRNNPLKYVDADGHFPISPILVGAFLACHLVELKADARRFPRLLTLEAPSAPV